MRFFAAALLGAFIPMAALAADTPPPADAMKLSAVLSALENRVGDKLAYVDQAEWDDHGYWKIEYYTTDGAEVKVRLDPKTAEPQG